MPSDYGNVINEKYKLDNPHESERIFQQTKIS